ncbi:DUF3667 domain-containing protein [Flavobacterium lacus]|jgi:hypothetical protein|uniref:Uncharacterized protein DUF3667 n=1 Tax=Flavobacterium lacus TaxID=1353778 RepID=A0A328X149_9FLAO|nr:DUF3667 domain-containing protein [Flavobacterium lacus]RAR48949.1 uncharacterized protein DUF3667 [Flavobacterium lacus]
MSCKNCQKLLLAEDKFCSNCGAQVVTQKLTVKKVIHEFSERYLSFDNKFLSTYKTLFTHPEWVVNGYLEGLRVRYVNPITYLIIAVTLSGISIYLIKRGYFGEIDFKSMQGNDKIPFDMKEYMNTIYDYNSVMVFLSIPLLAFISKIVFFNYKQFNYAEHNLIYFYTYSQSSISVLLMIPFLLFLKIEFYYYSILTFTFLLVYHCFALKRIFNLTGKQLIKKTLLFLLMLTLLYIIFIIIAAILMIIYMVSSGKFNPQDFAQ